MGIPRLKMPHDAPSRSTLKLAEALIALIGEQERDARLRPGMRAVDLGAAPGGWSWQMARRGVHVIAVDNGPMAASVIATGMVEHLRADGFTWRPRRPADWLLCDMAAQPARIAALAADWIATGQARAAIFNLKLPMKKRLDEVDRCRAIVEERLRKVGLRPRLRLKHLYHDREEVTGYLRCG
jgi:23S rRNA (cytidine2498-2'-O)-methyltransferase